VGSSRLAVPPKRVSRAQDVPPKEQQGAVALATFHKSEIDKWWPIVKSANISVKAE
jgi:hypothetical protein